MPKKQCCDAGFRVDAIVNVDERGQMILPKELRERAGLKPGDKLAVATFEREGQFCCMCLMKADALAGMVKDLLGPMMQHLDAN
ncbi:MAG: AbrB/MazE/SpoVT family DNA-binding domain-containing protein [Candidatus Hydrogenedentes bacterium]|nr:AbrB/MazE/SpoVT family DNA-binding domain-containing protein [Candidatus Hydrogenedentota bacterium]